VGHGYRQRDNVTALHSWHVMPGAVRRFEYLATGSSDENGVLPPLQLVALQLVAGAKQICERLGGWMRVQPPQHGPEMNVKVLKCCWDLQPPMTVCSIWGFAGARAASGIRIVCVTSATAVTRIVQLTQWSSSSTNRTFICRWRMLSTWNQELCGHMGAGGRQRGGGANVWRVD
jgi:hypothetical protein